MKSIMRLSPLMAVTVAKLFFWTVPRWDYVEKAYRSFWTGFVTPNIHNILVSIIPGLVPRKGYRPNRFVDVFSELKRGLWILGYYRC